MKPIIDYKKCHALEDVNFKNENRVSELSRFTE